MSLLLMFTLCSCASGQSFCRTEEGLYSYDGRLYRNDGEIFLSEKELEYVELIEEFPDGITGAEWYTELYRYSDWLLLGIDDSRSLSGLEGYRYFLLLPDTDKSRADYQMPEGTPAAVCYNGASYRYERGGVSEDMLNSMEAVGFIQSLDEREPETDFQANNAGFLGHLLFECDGKLLIESSDGTYIVFALSECQNGSG